MTELPSRPYRPTCVLCGKEICAGEPYRVSATGARAHEGCIRNEEEDGNGYRIGG